MASFLITGGSGMVGAALTKHLSGQGHTVLILTRDANRHPSTNPMIQYRFWDPYGEQIDETSIQQADYIIHLAGANVAEKRWTAKRKQEILDSRVRSGQFLCKSLQRIPNRVQAVVAASAQGWYGSDPSIPNPRPFVETDPAFSDFLGDTCRQWEESVKSINDLGIRLVQLRIGIVLSLAGGALPEFYKPIRFGVSPILGGGDQVISWIHIDDLVRMIEWALLQSDAKGIFNAAAPHPVSNRMLMQSLSKAASRPFIPVPVPSFALKILLGEMSIEVLKSTTMSADKIQRVGFNFQYPAIDIALADLLSRNN